MANLAGGPRLAMMVEWAILACGALWPAADRSEFAADVLVYSRTAQTIRAYYFAANL